jgi:hypothetical protein
LICLEKENPVQLESRKLGPVPFFFYSGFNRKEQSIENCSSNQPFPYDSFQLFDDLFWSYNYRSFACLCYRAFNPSFFDLAKEDEASGSTVFLRNKI